MNKGMLKNKRLSFTAILLMLLSAVLCIALAGCSKDKNPTDNPKEEVTLTLTESELSIVCYESKAITYTISGTDQSPTFSSDNTAVAAVDSKGVVTGVAVGTANITVSVADKKATCVVTITKSEVAPTIGFVSEIKLQEGETFTGEVKALWNGVALSESVDWACTYAENAAENVATIAVNNGIITVNATAQGTTSFYVSATVRGQYVNKCVNVTVIEPRPVLYPISSISAKNDGYSVVLYTQNTGKLSTEQTIAFGVSEGGTNTENVKVEWEDVTESGKTISTVKDNDGTYTFTKNAAGEGVWKGTFTSTSGKTAEVLLYVTVKKVEQTIDYNPTLIVEKLETLDVSSFTDEAIEAATINGKDVFSSYNAGKLTLNKSNMPTTAATLGEGREFVLETADCIYHATATIYTQIITTKAELDNFAAIAKKNGDFNGETSGTKTGGLDGYFLLGANIEYNGDFTSPTDTGEIYNISNAAGQSWEDTLRYGFKGIFDGQGYNIDGMTIKYKTGPRECGGFIGVLNNAGIVRNISFTNAGLYENSGFICALGGGKIENVNVTFSSIGVGNELRGQGRTMGAFFSFQANTGASVSNCVVDAIGAKINTPSQASSYFKLGTAYTKAENLIVLTDNANLMQNTGGSAVYSTYAELIASGATDDLDTNYWTTIGGVPFLKNAATAIDTSNTITANITMPSLLAGQSTAFTVNEKYYVIETTGMPDGVTIAWDKITTTNDCAAANNITVTVKSLLNNSTATCNFSVTAVSRIGVNHERITTQAKDTFKVDLSLFSAYLGGSADVYYADTLIGDDVAVSSNSITLATSSITETATGGVTLTIYSLKDSTMYTFDVKIKIVHTIGTAAEFESIFKAGAQLYSTYQLTNDITLTADYTVPGVSLFGTFDGAGYTISGVRIRSSINTEWAARSFIATLASGATMKNVAFKEVEIREQSTFVSVLQGTIENVYVQYKSFNYDNQVQKATFGNPLYKTQNTGALKNIIVDFAGATVTGSVSTNTSYENSKAFGAFADGATLSNIAVLSVPVAYKDAVIATKSTKVYITYNNGTDNGAQIPSTDWDTTYWTMNKNSLPTFNGVAVSKTAGFTVSVAGIIVGESSTFKVADYCLLALGDNASGIATLSSDGTITISAKAAADATFSVYAYNIFDYDNPTEITVTVIGKGETLETTQVVNLGVTLNGGVATTGSSTITLDLTSVYTGSASGVSVSLNGTTLTTSASVENGKVSFNTSSIAATTYGAQNFMVNFTADNLPKYYEVPVLLITKSISAAADLTGLAALSDAIGGGGYFQLANDITLTEGKKGGSTANWVDLTYQIGTNGFAGTIDGNGYKIVNLQIRNSVYFIKTLTGTLKNITFENFLLGQSGGIVFNGSGTIENVTVNYKRIGDDAWGGVNGNHFGNNLTTFGFQGQTNTFTMTNVTVNFGSALQALTTATNPITTWTNANLYLLGKYADGAKLTNVKVTGITDMFANFVTNVTDGVAIE